MSVSVEKIDACKRRLKGLVPADRVTARMDQYFAEAAKTASQPGFRPGKVPLSLIRTRFKQDALQEAARFLLADAYDEAVREQKLKPVFPPQVENLQCQAGEPLSFDMVVEVEPEFTPPEFRKMKLVQKTPSTVSGPDVQGFLDGLRESKAVYSEQPEARIEWGDYVQCDYTLKTAEKTLEDRKDQWFYVIDQPGTGKLFGGLIGKAAGALVEGRETMPENFPNPEIARHEVAYRFDVKQVKKKTLPALDETFAKEFGVASCEELRERVSQYMQKERAERVRQELEAQAVDQLLERTPGVTLPEGLFQSKVESLYNERLERIRQRGIPAEQLEKMKTELKTAVEREITRSLTLQFVLGALFDREGLALTDAEVEDRRRRIASEVPADRHDLAEAWMSEAGHTVIVQNLKREKVMDLLISQADIQSPGA